MRFGIPLAVLNPSAWVEVTEEADRLGFESVWIPEHLVLPAAMAGSPHAGQEHPPIPPHTPVFDALGYLSFLAARTTQIHLGTYVYNIGLRHPFVVARAVATLAQLSGDRLEFGIGVGWLEAEWQAAGLDFASRGARVDEAIEVCQRLWSEPEVAHHGRFFDFEPVAFDPKPSVPPRIHIGGDGPAALRRAATVGDGWIPMNHTIDQIAEPIARMATLREESGRAGTVEVTLAGRVEHPADVERYAEAGVHRMMVRPWQRTSDAIDSLRRFADDFIDP